MILQKNVTLDQSIRSHAYQDNIHQTIELPYEGPHFVINACKYTCINTPPSPKSIQVIC
jgi:hypothetical protein